MNDLTQIQQRPLSNEFNRLSAEIAKILSLVVPVTMTADQQALWIASAVDALSDIRASEVEEVSCEVRRSITRHQQIVPEIAKLVAEHRSQRSKAQAQLAEDRAMAALPPVKQHVADRDRRNFTASDWAELNEHLAAMGSTVRYRPDGAKYRTT